MNLRYFPIWNSLQKRDPENSGNQNTHDEFNVSELKRKDKNRGNDNSDTHHHPFWIQNILV